MIMMQLHRLVGPDDFTLLLNMVHMGVLAVIIEINAL